MKDRIEKSVELKAPVDRVWRALTDHREFGEWFRVALDGPFVVGELSTGRITYPGYEHLEWKTKVLAMEPERRFAFTWVPYNEVPDDSEDPETLVEFRLEAMTGGTRLFVSESGFLSLPDDRRRVDALRQNEAGWEEQMGNIRAHVES